LWLGLSMVSDDMCDEIVLCHIRWVTIFCGSFSVEVRWVMTMCRVSSKGKFDEAFTNFLKTFKLLVFKSGCGCFLTLAKFSVLLGRVVTTLDGFLLKHPSVFITCLMNFRDGKWELKVGEREIVFPIVMLLWPILLIGEQDVENVLSAYHHAVQSVALNCARCIKINLVLWLFN